MVAESDTQSLDSAIAKLEKKKVDVDEIVFKAINLFYEVEGADGTKPLFPKSIDISSVREELRDCCIAELDDGLRQLYSLKERFSEA